MHNFSHSKAALCGGGELLRRCANGTHTHTQLLLQTRWPQSLCSTPAARQITSHAPDALYRFIAAALLRWEKLQKAAGQWKTKTTNARRFLWSRDFLLCATRYILIGRRRVRSKQRAAWWAHSVANYCGCHKVKSKKSIIISGLCGSCGPHSSPLFYLIIQTIEKEKLLPQAHLFEDLITDA